MTGITVRPRAVAAAVVLAIALVAGVGTLQGANATTLGDSTPVDAAMQAMQRIESSPSYLAAERAVLAGQPVPVDAKRVLEADVTAFAASADFQAAARQLAPALAGTAIGERGVPEFMYHLNQGNQRMLAAVGVFTVLVVPGILSCSIGSAASCAPFWLLVGANLASSAVISGVFEYEQAVLALA